MGCLGSDQHFSHAWLHFYVRGMGGVQCKMRELVAFVLTYSLTGYVHCSVGDGFGYRRTRLAPSAPDT